MRKASDLLPKVEDFRNSLIDYGKDVAAKRFQQSERKRMVLAVKWGELQADLEELGVGDGGYSFRTAVRPIEPAIVDLVIRSTRTAVNLLEIVVGRLRTMRENETLAKAITPPDARASRPTWYWWLLLGIVIGWPLGFFTVGLIHFAKRALQEFGRWGTFAVLGGSALVFASVLGSLLTSGGWAGIQKHPVRSFLLLVLALGLGIFAAVVATK